MLVAIAWAYALWIRPHVFLRNGHWAEARLSAELLERSFWRIFPSAVRGTAAYVRALTLHLEGDFEGSLAALATLGEVRSLRQATLLLEAGSLLLAGRDAERANAAAREACAIHPPQPEDLLLLAHTELSCGRRVMADAAFARAPVRRPLRAPWPVINEPVFHYLRALFLLKTGRAAEARGDLEAAARARPKSVYVERAKQLLPIDQGDEPPPSLSPLVLGE